MDSFEEDFDVESIPHSLNIQPYMFEPPARDSADHVQSAESTEASSEEDDLVELGVEGQNHDDRRLNTTWCECGSCQVMATALECVCCAEISAVDHIRETYDIECITRHPIFIDNCLSINVLHVSIYEYIRDEGPLDDNEPINEVYRHIAYRRFVMWIWHRLGKGNRKVLPACVVSKIRETFPSEEFTGFKYPRPGA